MSKRNRDGDVLFNRVNVGMAKSQRLLASLMGSKPAPEPANVKKEREQEREELEDEIIAPEQIGIGGIIPKTTKDGGFTQRALTTDDKLLQTLIGKKRAKAHIAAKETTRCNTTPINFNKPDKHVKKPKPEESEDEDEGRSSAFQSKRQKKKISRPAPAGSDIIEAQEDALEISLTRRPASAGDDQAFGNQDTPLTKLSTREPEKEDDENSTSNLNSTKSRSKKCKPVSYLDEILAERLKKKKKKGI
ncbi:hypothetical protein K504DRAFT_401791 [Pleomassaria siparia CBS 279.74]|uniref:Uncharacterized protein n=1 Tax=Pleomassaria siparia CBS 279.74 TaxID=1314801 RepID=A0A6G1KIL7_9PLEO|nr:hypothetical protein K504DRAFT_401791 [Pleomassaria siparia CBS 279.74]